MGDIIIFGIIQLIAIITGIMIASSIKNLHTGLKLLVSLVVYAALSFVLYMALALFRHE